MAKKGQFVGTNEATEPKPGFRSKPDDSLLKKPLSINESGKVDCGPAHDEAASRVRESLGTKQEQ